MDCPKLNTRIQELSTGLEGVGASLGTFASDIKGAIGGMHVDPPSTTGWSDDVCARTISIMQSVDSLLKSKESEADSISSAASAVDDLKSASDEYMEAYAACCDAVEKFKATYSGGNPYEEEPDKSNWEREKEKAEAECKKLIEQVLSLEESALSKEEAVKGCFSGAASAPGGLTGNYEATELTGSELQSFCSENCINPNRVTIKKAVVDVGGTNYDVYYVYDNQLEEFDKLAFNVYVHDSLEKLGNLEDKELLKAVNNTYLIFEQDQGIDKGGAYIERVQAWFRPSVDGITSWFGTVSGFDYGVQALIHEFGHAVDSLVGYNETGSHVNMSSREIDKAEWMNIIKKEASWTIQRNTDNYPFLCPTYSGASFFTNNNGEYIAEYIAEAFAMYNYSAEARAELLNDAPETYKKIEELIKRAKK